MPNRDKLVEFLQPAWKSITENYQQWLIALVVAIVVFFVLRWPTRCSDDTPLEWRNVKRGTGSTTSK